MEYGVRRTGTPKRRVLTKSQVCVINSVKPEVGGHARMTFSLVVLSLVLIALILRGILRLGEAMPVWEGTTPG